MWTMILLMSRLTGGHSMSAGRRSEKLGYQQSTVCWYALPGDWFRQFRTTRIGSAGPVFFSQLFYF